MKTKGNTAKLQIFLLLIFLVIIGGLLIYYFGVYNADPKIKIVYSISGGIEQKNATNYEQLYKNSGNIDIDIELDRQPPAGKEYYSIVNDSKEKLSFEQKGNSYISKIIINPDKFKNSYYTVQLTDSKGKTYLNDNFNVIVLRPSMSSKEFVENYMKIYSDAVMNKNSSGLFQLSGYWIPDQSDRILAKMRNGFSNLFSYWYDRIISTPDDNVSAKVFISSNLNNVYTYSEYTYRYKLTVVKGNSGLPEWKIESADETLDKREKSAFLGDGEGEGD